MLLYFAVNFFSRKLIYNFGAFEINKSCWCKYLKCESVVSHMLGIFFRFFPRKKKRTI